MLLWCNTRRGPPGCIILTPGISDMNYLPLVVFCPREFSTAPGRHVYGRNRRSWGPILEMMEGHVSTRPLIMSQQGLMTVLCVVGRSVRCRLAWAVFSVCTFSSLSPQLLLQMWRMFYETSGQRWQSPVFPRFQVLSNTSSLNWKYSPSSMTTCWRLICSGSQPLSQHERGVCRLMEIFCINSSMTNEQT